MKSEKNTSLIGFLRYACPPEGTRHVLSQIDHLWISMRSVFKVLNLAIRSKTNNVLNKIEF